LPTACDMARDEREEDKNFARFRRRPRRVLPSFHFTSSTCIRLTLKVATLVTGCAVFPLRLCMLLRNNTSLAVVFLWFWPMNTTFRGTTTTPDLFHLSHHIRLVLQR